MARSLGILAPDQVVARARSVIGKGIHYELGKGGRDPFAALPSGAGKTCDCSGFVAWCLGVDRYLDNSGVPHLEGLEWFETSAIVRDSLQRGLGFCDEVRWQDALPGDLLVYGDSRNPDGTARQGHIGVVASLGPMGPETVVHCSKGNDRDSSDAIRETAIDLFARRHALVVRVAWVRAPLAA